MGITYSHPNNFQGQWLKPQRYLQADPANTLLINSYSWSKENHGLYDYEGSDNINNQFLKVDKSCVVFKNEDKIQSLNAEEFENMIKKCEKPKQIENIQPLIMVNKLNNGYYLKEFPSLLPQQKYSQQQQQQQKRYDYQTDHSMWLIVRALKWVKDNKKGCLLQENDFLKLGRVKLRVREISNNKLINLQKEEKQLSNNNNINNNSGVETNRNPPNQENINNINNINQNLNVIQIQNQKDSDQYQQEQEEQKMQLSQKSSKSQKSNSEVCCRICYGEEEDSSNPIITPCKCSGSVKYIHLQCLQQWLQNKVVAKNSSYSTCYLWKNLQCELCNTIYPQQFEVKGQKVEAFKMKKPSSPYIIIEVLNNKTGECKEIHVVSMQNKNQIKIGRGSDSDMKVTDISVSRFHGAINYINGNFYLLDHNSKFGTLAQVQNGIKISHEINKVAVQINRTVLQFYVKPPGNSYNICGCITPSLKNKDKNQILLQNQLESEQKVVQEQVNQKIDQISTSYKTLHKKLIKLRINLFKINFDLGKEGITAYKNQIAQDFNNKEKTSNNNKKESTTQLQKETMERKKQEEEEEGSPKNCKYPKQINKNNLNLNNKNEKKINEQKSSVNLQKIPDLNKQATSQHNSQQSPEKNKKNMVNQINLVPEKQQQVNQDNSQNQPIYQDKKELIVVNEDDSINDEKEEKAAESINKVSKQKEVQQPAYPNGQFNDIQDLEIKEQQKNSQIFKRQLSSCHVESGNTYKNFDNFSKETNQKEGELQLKKNKSLSIVSNTLQNQQQYKQNQILNQKLSQEQQEIKEQKLMNNNNIEEFQIEENEINKNQLINNQKYSKKMSDNSIQNYDSDKNRNKTPTEAIQQEKGEQQNASLIDFD